MSAHLITIDTCVQVDGHCPLACQVIGDQAELTFGREALSLLLDEQGLAKVAAITTQALTRLHAIPDGAEVEFRVSTSDSAPDRIGAPAN
jgi:hypothetical protein